MSTEHQTGSLIPEEPSSRKNGEERREILSRTLQTQIAQGGRIESQSDYSAVVVNGHRPNHTLHLILTLVTFGLWGLAWIGMAWLGGEKRTAVSVDEFGTPLVQRL